MTTGIQWFNDPWKCPFIGIKNKLVSFVVSSGDLNRIYLNYALVVSLETENDNPFFMLTSSRPIMLIIDELPLYSILQHNGR